MTKKELETYSELNEQFIEDCNRVCHILQGIEKHRKSEYSNYAYADEFNLEGDVVEWSGEETWSYGGHEYHSGNFPKEYLTMTDEELQKIVDKENKEYFEKQEAKKKEREERQREQELAKLKELKEKYEK